MLVYVVGIGSDWSCGYALFGEGADCLQMGKKNLSLTEQEDMRSRVRELAWLVWIRIAVGSTRFSPWWLVTLGDMARSWRS